MECDLIIQSDNDTTGRDTSPALWFEIREPEMMLLIQGYKAML